VGKTTGLSALSGSLCIWNRSQNRDFSHEFAFDNKELKRFIKSVENVRSSNVVELKFELRHIPRRSGGDEENWPVPTYAKSHRMDCC